MYRSNRLNETQTRKLLTALNETLQATNVLARAFNVSSNTIRRVAKHHKIDLEARALLRTTLRTKPRGASVLQPAPAPAPKNTATLARFRRFAVSFTNKTTRPRRRISWPKP
jgi:hypothetical protein